MVIVTRKFFKLGIASQMRRLFTHTNAVIKTHQYYTCYEQVCCLQKAAINIFSLVADLID